MLRELPNARFQVGWRLLRRRYRFQAGAAASAVTIGAAQFTAWGAQQESEPVAVGELERRRFWWYRGRFWSEDEGLSVEDVRALVAERERRKARKLERAHSMLAQERSADPLRPSIPLSVKRQVWDACGGRCAECGSGRLLEFDHIIPLAMGGSSGPRNLQLLCVDCNRAKGADL